MSCQKGHTQLTHILVLEAAADIFRVNLVGFASFHCAPNQIRREYFYLLIASPFSLSPGRSTCCRRVRFIKFGIDTFPEVSHKEEGVVRSASRSSGRRQGIIIL